MLKIVSQMLVTLTQHGKVLNILIAEMFTVKSLYVCMLFVLESSKTILKNNHFKKIIINFWLSTLKMFSMYVPDSP
jgi:hypothetical protein